MTLGEPDTMGDERCDERCDERKVRSQRGAEICIAKTKNIIYISVQEGNPRNRQENNRKRMTDYSNQSQNGIAKTKEEVE